MKLNKKIIIPAFTLLVGTTLAGSVASTVAWYQYSTRTNVSYIGTSAGTVGNLQIRLADGEWGTRLSIQDVRDYLSAEGIGQQVEPVTSGPMAKNDALKKYAWKEVQVSRGESAPSEEPQNGDPIYFIETVNHKLYKFVDDAWELQANEALAEAPELASVNTGDVYLSNANKLFEKAYVEKDFYANPIAGFASYEKWIKADNSKYVKLPLQLRFIAQDEAHLSPEDVYISKLLIQKDRNNGNEHGDISDAIRVHFSAYETGDEENAVNKLVSKNGGTTLTHGKLKLEGGNDFDKAYADDDEFGFGGSELAYVNYGGVDGDQKSYAAKVNQENGVYYEEEAPASGWTLVGSFNAAAAAPNDSDGAPDGTFYLDSTENNEKLYKKADGHYAVFAATFSSGAAAPDLESDDSEQYYLDTAASKIYECGFHKEAISPILVSSEDDSLELDNLDDDKKIGTTIESVVPPAEQHYLNVDVTIWVEGWHKFDRNDKLTSIWDQNLIGAIFDVGIQFAVQDIR